ncbi:MAG: GAF domain-containing sensor histidine kinase [Verrucomicrobiota bacterium JB023]|nr:GAF domain-containing sensor histidine kinase [Verrucomicrobiota bacterium JB023]
MSFQSSKGVRAALSSNLTEILEPLDMLEFDRITRLASSILKVPVCLVSLVDEERQFFAGACGLPRPWSQERQTPLSHSFCQTVVATRQVIIVKDAREDERFRENLAIRDLGVIAYLGFPLVEPTGHAIGAFCVIDSEPRQWTETEIDTARDFAALAMTQIQYLLEQERHRSLLDVLAHDLKTPLAAIDFSSRILMEKKGDVPDSLEPLLGNILESSERSFELLEQTTQRQQTGQGRETVELKELAEDLVESLNQSCDEKRIELTVACHLPAPSAMADRWIVERVLENLLTNAIKYSPHGSEIALEICCDDGLAGYRVKDSGPGFSEADVAGLYQRYARLSATPTGGEPSSGMGLSIAKRLISQVGGRLELISRPGESAHFEALFPLPVNN